MLYLKTVFRLLLFLFAIHTLAHLFYLLSPGSDQAYPSFAQIIFGTVGYFLLQVFKYPLALFYPDYPFFGGEPGMAALLGWTLLNVALQALLLAGGFYLFRRRLRD